jgi:cytochrome c biogenesis protein CcdA/thiol-disulfide isomerase/thioredoxin
VTLLRIVRKSMRLDLKGFQRRKRAGIIVVTLVSLISLLAFMLALYGSKASSVYLKVEGKSIPNLAALQNLLKESKKPIAVMFESPTCPVCKRMYPHWLKLEEASGTLPVEFYHIMYSSESASAFRHYSVFDTPTFIVFINGKPVARHVGAFEGDNVTAVMLSWALGAAGLSSGELAPEKLAREGLKIFNSKCSRCHLHIGDLSVKAFHEWLEEGVRMADPLATVVSDALKANMSLDEYYGGYNKLMDAVSSMRKYISSLSSYEIDRVSYYLSYITRLATGRKPLEINTSIVSSLINSSRGPATPLREEASIGRFVGLIGALAAFVAGLVAAFSPCVLPLLLTQTATIAASGSRVSASGCAACGLASFAGVLSMGLLFAVLGSVAASIQRLLLPTVAAAITAAGLASLLGVPIEIEASPRLRRGGLLGFCTVYGLLSVQCSLPLVVGSLLLAAGTGGVAGVIVAVSFALGVSLPLAVAVYAVSRAGAGFVNRILARNRLLNVLGGIVLAASGIYLLIYSISML